MKLCVVVQRYGLEVAGGAELHCRWLAGRLARRHTIEVVTTCALDYLEWRNHYPPGGSVIEGIRVTRFPVRRTRDKRRFARIQERVFHDEHTLDDERTWVEENGPFCPDLVRALRGMREVDLFVFYCYRYYHSFFGLPGVRERAVLVPTAEEDPAVELPVFGRLLRAPRGIVYLTPEERSLVEGVSSTRAPAVVVGSGINVAPGWRELDPRARFGLRGPYLLYAGRIDRNKGADCLIDQYLGLLGEWPELPPLVLVGGAALPVPRHDRVRYLGFVSEQEKFALIAGCELLLLPSCYESLSVAVLEAWAMARPVLVNGACRVLEGQCVRSGGGLFYRGYAEFAEALRLLLGSAELRARLGAAGRAYVEREYAWELVESRADAFLRGLVG
jgi:glycosyltransferase involved in cell wall biosynthesis